MRANLRKPHLSLVGFLLLVEEPKVRAAFTLKLSIFSL